METECPGCDDLLREVDRLRARLAEVEAVCDEASGDHIGGVTVVRVPTCAANGCRNRATGMRKSYVPGWPDEPDCGQHPSITDAEMSAMWKGRPPLPARRDPPAAPPADTHAYVELTVVECLHDKDTCCLCFEPADHPVHLSAGSGAGSTQDGDDTP